MVGKTHFYIFHTSSSTNSTIIRYLYYIFVVNPKECDQEQLFVKTFNRTIYTIIYTRYLYDITLFGDRGTEHVLADFLI